MPLAVVHSRSIDALQAPQVAVEVHLANGLPSFTLVGLADTEVKEARERVRAALQTSGLEFPHNKRITVNLAPADLPKESGRFDLPIAIGILAASGQIDARRLDAFEFAGELSLAGDLRPIRGALAMGLAAQRATREPRRALVLPDASACEAALVDGLAIHRAAHLLDVVRAFAAPGEAAARIGPAMADAVSGGPVRAHSGADSVAGVDAGAGADAGGARDADARTASRIDAKAESSSTTGEDLALPRAVATARRTSADHGDFAEVRGQAAAKRALEIAAAGGHSVLMVGPPGTGKSMLAQRFATLLPPLDDDAALESAAVLSLAGAFALERWAQRPVRAPHHSASAAALIGGGSPPRPGEITLAHHGVLFLDELPEFPRVALEALREPLETGRIAISRAARQATFPARFQLLGAMNPCACGHLGSPQRHCRCTPDAIARYQGRLSGPLLDRIDLQVEVPAVAPAALAAAADGEPSAVIAARVAAAQGIALGRQQSLNAQLAGAALDRHAALDAATSRFLQAASTRLGWSARSHHRVLRIARTIADLTGSAAVDAAHVAEAIQYRRVVDPA